MNQQIEQQVGNLNTSSEYVNVQNDGQLEIQKEKEKNERLQKKLSEVENDRVYLQSILTKSANPSPVCVALMIVAVLCVLWMIHYIFIKPKLTGEWYPEAGSDVWYLNQKFMSNTVDVKINGKNYGTLELIDNLITYDGRVAIWNYGNTIIFINGMVLTKSLN